MKPKQPTLVLMAGFPGSGKTTLAAKLGRELGYPILDRDWLKVSFLKDGLDDERAGWFAYEATLAYAEHLLVKQGLSILLDCSAHRRFVINRIREITRIGDVELKVLLCVVDSKIRSQRIKGRKEYNGLFSYHLVRMTSIEEDIQEFAHLPLPPSPITCILNTAEPLSLCVKKALEHLLR